MRKRAKVTGICADRGFKLLDFCPGRNGSSVYTHAHRKSLVKAKKKLILLTKRNQGNNVRDVMKKVEIYMRGWLGYFHVAEMRQIMKSWDEWLWRRFRMYI